MGIWRNDQYLLVDKFRFPKKEGTTYMFENLVSRTQYYIIFISVQCHNGKMAWGQSWC